MTARDPRLAAHSLRDDERPSPRRPITMHRDLWARIDAARGEQSCAEWLREAAVAKLESREDGLLVQIEETARLLVGRLTTGDLTPARRLAAVRREFPAFVEILRELDQARGRPVRTRTRTRPIRTRSWRTHMPRSLHRHRQRSPSRSVGAGA